MLLYLNSKTWVDAEQCELLARDVRAAFESHRKTKIILLHENDRSRGGCEFVTFFKAKLLTRVSDYCVHDSSGSPGLKSLYKRGVSGKES